MSKDQERMTMPSVILIDDDHSTEILAENLGFYGIDVRRIASASEALQSIEDVAAANAVILDIIMKQPTSAATSGISGDRNTGMGVLKALRGRNPSVPVLVFSATNDADLIDALRRDPHTQFLSKWNSPSLRELVHIIEGLVGVAQEEPKHHSFIVHGHDEAAKLSLKNYLQNTLKLPEPVILHEQPNFGRTIIEKFEDYAAKTDLVFVLLTPDDIVVEAGRPDDEKRRARQNVIFELGYFLGALGRSSGRVFLLHKAPLDLPSDISGIVYIDISSGIDAAGETLRRELVRVI